MVISALLLLGWREMRRDHALAGGAAVGAAAALKLYPQLLLVPLAAWRRRALAAAVLTVIGAAMAVTLVAGIGVWFEYAAAARVIARAFVDAPNNLSLATRLASGLLVPASVGWLAYPVLAAVAVALTLAWARWTVIAGETICWDVRFALFVALPLVLSPVAWHHYVSMLALPLAVLARATWGLPGRAGLLVVRAMAILLSLPDTAWRVLWQVLPARAALLASPGIVAVAVWMALLASGRQGGLVPEPQSARSAR